ncbi:hypothetical protein [Streptomyces xanthophaeus]
MSHRDALKIASQFSGGHFTAAQGQSHQNCQGLGASADTLCRGGVIWHQGNLETMVIDGFQDPTT